MYPGTLFDPDTSTWKCTGLEATPVLGQPHRSSDGLSFFFATAIHPVHFPRKRIRSKNLLRVGQYLADLEEGVSQKT